MSDSNAFDRTANDLKQAFNGHGLIFTPLGEADADRFAKFMEADNWAWISHLGGAPHKSYDAREELAAMNREARTAGNHFDFLVQREVDGPYIAHRSITLDPASGIAMTSSFVIPSQRSAGFSTQISSITRSQLAELAPDLGVNQVLVRILESNKPSHRVMEKLGFEPSGKRLGSYVEYVQELNPDTSGKRNER